MSCISFFFHSTVRKSVLPSFKKVENFFIKKAKILSLSEPGLQDLKWWLWTILNAKNHINAHHVGFKINTDAIKTEWAVIHGSNPT